LRLQLWVDAATELLVTKDKGTPLRQLNLGQGLLSRRIELEQAITRSLSENE